MNWWTRYNISENRYTVFAVAVLLINHGVGLAGLNSSYASTFEALSWLNLLLSFILVAFSFNWKTTPFWLFVSFSFVIGLGVEILGITTGWPFGSYYYTTILGAGLLGVPLIIALNWALLAMGCGTIAGYCASKLWIKILLGAVIMVLVDILLEPFAIRHHLWVWQGGQPAIGNYLGWFATAMVIQYAYFTWIKEKGSYLPAIYIVILSLFLYVDIFLQM